MQLNFFTQSKTINDYRQWCESLSGSADMRPDAFGAALRHWSRTNLNVKIRTLALFSGGGGLDIGFSDAGFHVVEAVEIEPKFVQTMEFNKKAGSYFQHTNIVCDDVRNYNPSFEEPIDFIIGGPPCQSFSAAGRRAAGVAGTRDQRGSLFEEYVRILGLLQPKGFLFENVYGLLGAEKGEAIKKIAQAFREVGYETFYRVLDAADYGVPQHRERLIVVGRKRGTFRFPIPTHGADSNGTPYLSAEEAIRNIDDNDSERLPSLNGRFGHLLKDVPPGLNYSYFTEKMGHPEPIFAWRSKFSDFLYKADPHLPIRTLKASGGQYTGPFHWESRHFTIAELKRLQTFPDDYFIIGKRGVASKQIGNSVPPQFARTLALSVLNQVFNADLPFDINYLSESDALTFRTVKANRTASYRSKAAGARILNDSEVSKIVGRTYKISIAKNFKVSADAKKGDYAVTFLPTSNHWNLEISNESIPNSSVYEITLRKKSKDALFREVKSISLSTNDPSLKALTALWKALEKELADNHIKADLVQLNGYYQYPTDLVFSLREDEQAMAAVEEWAVITYILSDPEIGTIQPIANFALRYDLPEEKLMQVFKKLRIEAGYEIRNHNTNPEIDSWSYLIPYRFPTLTPLSVQLKRQL